MERWQWIRLNDVQYRLAARGPRNRRIDDARPRSGESMTLGPRAADLATTVVGGSVDLMAVLGDAWIRRWC